MMVPEHITTWTNDSSGVTWSAYHKPDDSYTFWLKVGVAVVEIPENQIEDVINLLQLVKQDIQKETRVSFDEINYEDAFVVGDDEWITLPGEEGRVSPDGVVHAADGTPLYSLYEDADRPVSIYSEEEYDY